MQVEFSSLVQQHVDASESEINGEELWKLFNDTYLHTLGIPAHRDHRFRAIVTGHSGAS